MKKLLLFLFVVSLILVSACEPLGDPEPEIIEQVLTPVSDGLLINTTVEEAEPTEKDYPTERVSIKYARNFTLEYKDGYKLLTVNQPWVGANQSYSYALVPKELIGKIETGNALVIGTPIESFVSMSTTYYPFLENIDKLDTLVGVDSLSYSYNESVNAMANEGKLVLVGGGGSGMPVDLEGLIRLQPELIMASATGSVDYDVHPQLLQAGLPVVLNSDYLEQDPLGRAEWGVFIAAFYELESEAASQFDQLVLRYEAAKALTQEIVDKVTVFTNTDYQGTWYTPGNQSYVAFLLNDAGADYLWKDLQTTGASPIAFEEVFERAHDADYWINVGFPSDLTSLKAMDERYGDFKAFIEGNVFNFNRRVNENGAVDYYESGVAFPDLVLQDLIKIFYPDLLPDYELYYYQQLN